MLYSKTSPVRRFAKRRIFPLYSILSPGECLLYSRYPPLLLLRKIVIYIYNSNVTCYIFTSMIYQNFKKLCAPDLKVRERLYMINGNFIL